MHPVRSYCINCSLHARSYSIPRSIYGELSSSSYINQLIKSSWQHACHSNLKITRMIKNSRRVYACVYEEKLIR